MSRELDAFLHFLFLSTALVYWKVKRPEGRLTYLYPLGLFLIATFIFDGLAVLIMFNGFLSKTINTNLFLYHILIPIQFVCVMSIYAKVFKAKKYITLVTLLAYLFIGISIIFTLFIQSIFQYNSYEILIKHVLIILVVLLYFYELIKTIPYLKLYRQPIFWISVAFLFHSLVNILLEGTSNYFKTYSTPVYSILYILYSISNYILFILLTIGIINIRPIDFKQSAEITTR